MSETSFSSASDAHDSVYERCDAAYLRQLHETSGMDETQLARIACLSVAQVRQLATGGDSLFYSQAVKRQAYKRLLLILGAPPPSQVEPVPAEAAHTESAPPSQTIDDIVALSERNQYLDHRPVVDFLRDLRLRIVQSKQTLAAFVLLMTALVLLVLNWPSGESTAVSDDVSTVTAPERANKDEAKPPVLKEPAPAEKPSDKPTDAADKPADKPHESEKAIEKATEKAADKVVEKAVTAPVMGAKVCAFKSDKLPEVAPTVATKEARYVYFVSAVATEVCVVDGNRQATSLALRAGEGRSVYGAPPWQVSGADLAKVQIFFQGWRVAVPDDASQGIALTEKPR